MQEIQFYLVDAFSDKNFGGNAAAVCPLSEWLADDVLLKMAQQHNQSETAFFVHTDEGYELRWFTTLGEINLCGHATLATAHVIFEYLDHPSATITFSTRFVGELRVTRRSPTKRVLKVMVAEGWSRYSKITCAVARVAWPQRLISPSVVNQRSS